MRRFQIVTYAAYLARAVFVLTALSLEANEYSSNSSLYHRCLPQNYSEAQKCLYATGAGCTTVDCDACDGAGLSLCTDGALTQLGVCLDYQSGVTACESLRPSVPRLATIVLLAMAELMSLVSDLSLPNTYLAKGAPLMPS